MNRTPSQEVMDAARGDPEGKLRAAAYERWSAFPEIVKGDSDHPSVNLRPDPAVRDLCLTSSDWLL